VNDVDDARDTCRYPKQLKETTHKIRVSKKQSKPFYLFSFPVEGQLKNPKMNDRAATHEIPHCKLTSKLRKKPLTQPATTVSLKISKKAVDIRLLLSLLNIFTIIRLSGLKMIVKC